jgi:hypothetical protein
LSTTRKNIKQLQELEGQLVKEIEEKETKKKEVQEKRTTRKKLPRGREEKRDRGIYNYNGLTTANFASIVRSVFAELGKSMGIKALLRALPSRQIIGTDSERRLIVTEEEYKYLTKYQDRYFADPFIDKNGEKFYVFSEWGRYEFATKKGRRIFVRGNIYNLIDHLAEMGIIITQVGGRNYSNDSI